MTQHRDGGAGWMWLSMAIGSVAVMGGLLSVTGMLGAAAIPIWGVTMIAALVILRGPLGKAMAARLSGQGAEGEVAQVPEEVYAELDELRARLLEMEERQDFAERLLARRSETADEAGGAP